MSMYQINYQDFIFPFFLLQRQCRLIKLNQQPIFPIGSLKILFSLRLQWRNSPQVFFRLLI